MAALSVNGVAKDKRVVSVALVPLSPDAPVWQGRVRPDQVVVASLQRPVPVWWERIVTSLAEAMRDRREVAWLREHLQANQKAHADWVEHIAKDGHLGGREQPVQ